jgi:predicted RNase H-like nuclease (RuvC/YqgF family)
MKLRPVTYHLDMDKLARWQKTPDSLRMRKDEQQKAAEVQIGFIAQEVEQAANELNFDFHAVDKPKNAEDKYGLRYAEFVPVLVKALQDQQKEIEDIKNENKDLKKRLERLEKIMIKEKSVNK